MAGPRKALDQAGAQTHLIAPVSASAPHSENPKCLYNLAYDAIAKRCGEQSFLKTRYFADEPNL